MVLGLLLWPPRRRPRCRRGLDQVRRPLRGDSTALKATGSLTDEGFSGAFNSKDFQATIHYDSYDEVAQANIKANVSAMVQIGSVGGALFAFIIADRIGRIWATRVLCLFWVTGIAMFMGAQGSLPLIYAGRFIAGLGVGQTPVVGPVYIAEIAVSYYSSPATVSRSLCFGAGANEIVFRVCVLSKRADQVYGGVPLTLSATATFWTHSR